MSDADKKPMVEIRIQFDGQATQVSGPITNELLCQAMLESAGQVVRDFNLRRKMDEVAKAAVPPLVQPSNGNTPKDLHIA